MLSVAYAGRHPQKVAGVINFAGGWWGERMPTREFNFDQFRQAGRSAKAPMLWMYGTNDSYYSPKFIQRCFDAFRNHGGKGELIEVPDVPGDGHFLVSWPDRWRPAVSTYLGKLGLRGEYGQHQ
jgi:pimeloyl-ACP methyl ester carboxylesterase